MLDADREALGEIQEILGRLYRSSDSLDSSISSEFQKITNKLDTWILSNQRLLEVIVLNSQEIQRSTRSYESGIKLFKSLNNQLLQLQQATTKLSELLEFSPLAAATVAPPLPSNPETLTQLSQLHKGLNQALINLQNLQAIFSKSVEGQIEALNHWSQENSEILPQKSIETTPKQTGNDKRTLWFLGIGFACMVVTAGINVAIAISLPQQVQAQNERAVWANSREGRFARNLMDWNHNQLPNCMEDAKQIGVTLKVNGRFATSGFCTLWVEPPEQRQFEEK